MKKFLQLSLLFRREIELEYLKRQQARRALRSASAPRAPRSLDRLQRAISKVGQPDRLLRALEVPVEEIPAMDRPAQGGMSPRSSG